MFIEAHTHLDHYKKEVLDAALKEIEDNKIITLNNSMDIPSYLKNLEIGKRSKLIVNSFGIHPWKAQEYENRLEEIENYIDSTSSIGEIGLDFFWIEGKRKYEAQVKVFKFFLEKARKQNKIINIHTKGAESEVLELLDKYSIEKVIVHWYSGPLDVLKKMIERGYYFTVGVELAYSNIIKEISKEIPINRILTETDNPGGEEWLGGNIGMPILIKKVVDDLAKLKGLSPQELNHIVTKNFNTLNSL